MITNLHDDDEYEEAMKHVIDYGDMLALDHVRNLWKRSVTDCCVAEKRLYKRAFKILYETFTGNAGDYTEDYAQLPGLRSMVHRLTEGE